MIHERARLGVLTSLAAHPKGLAFDELRRLCGLTDGNLSRHLAVLQEAGLVEVTKGFDGATATDPVPDHRAKAGSASSTTWRCSTRWCATPPAAAAADRRR